MIGVLGGLSLIVGLFSLIDTSTSTSFSVTYLVMSITKDQYRMLMQGLEIVARYPIEELKETPSIT